MASLSKNECEIAVKVVQALEESEKTASSYYLSMKEKLKDCEKQCLIPPQISSFDDDKTEREGSEPDQAV